MAQRWTGDETLPEPTTTLHIYVSPCLNKFIKHHTGSAYLTDMEIHIITKAMI